MQSPHVLAHDPQGKQLQSAKDQQGDDDGGVTRHADVREEILDEEKKGQEKTNPGGGEAATGGELQGQQGEVGEQVERQTDQLGQRVPGSPTSPCCPCS